ncbi:MAG: DUF2336 domain-containing protein [Alphaproteobacteria bacterium]|nr:DUF2336 domain-containing protein [Alphaproteobacteria bacterium]
MSARDVAALLENPSAEQRARIFARMAPDIDSARLSPQELQLALDIMRTLAADAELIVRRAVAESMKASRHLPHDVALRLARDEVSVAVPVLEHASVLTDDDLISILADGVGAKQVAIARRPQVSATLAAAIVDTGNAAAVTTLVGNTGADLSEPVLQKTLDRYGRFETVKGAMVHREQLPVTIAERLVTLVSEKLKLAIATRHSLPASIASEIILDARERATLTLLSDSPSDADTRALVQQLHANGRLTASLVLRALCSGDLEFVEEAMAEIAGTSAEKASILIHDAGKLGLRALFSRCEFPEALYPAFRVAVDVIHETSLDGEGHDRERFARRVIERVLTQYQDLDGDDLDYLLGKLRRLEAA